MTDFVLWLTWKCLECGWTFTVAAPGFAGDGHFHYEQPDNRKCGPLCASKASRVSPAGVILTPEQAEQAVEDVARALYDRAMSERRSFSRDPAMFTGSWDDGTPDSRPSSWRDGWRDEARKALAVLRPGGAAPEAGT